MAAAGRGPQAACLWEPTLTPREICYQLASEANEAPNPPPPTISTGVWEKVLAPAGSPCLWQKSSHISVTPHRPLQVPPGTAPRSQKRRRKRDSQTDELTAN